MISHGDTESTEKKRWFRTEERIAALRSAARSWIGTPFFPNGRVKGSGVSCQFFAPALYEEIGFLPGPIVAAIPEGPMNWSRANKESLIAKHIDLQLQAYFVSVEERVPMVGDLLGIQIDECVQHLGVCLGERFVHVFQPRTPRVMQQDGVREDRVDLYLHRVARLWRPIE